MCIGIYANGSNVNTNWWAQKKKKIRIKQQRMDVDVKEN